MDNNDFEINGILNKIDSIELISDEEVDKMDFYQLAFYMQTLNQIDALGSNNGGEDKYE